MGTKSKKLLRVTARRGDPVGRPEICRNGTLLQGLGSQADAGDPPGRPYSALTDEIAFTRADGGAGTLHLHGQVVPIAFFAAVGGIEAQRIEIA